MASSNDPTPLANSASANSPDEPRLPIGAHPASIQALAKALAQLQKTALKAEYATEVVLDKDTDQRPQRAAKLPAKRPAGEPSDFVQYALISRNGTLRTSGREASRLYSGAKDFF